MLPKISIIVPVYNVKKYLQKCLESILTQTFNDFECILIDDASTDSSFEICKQYAIKDNRIKLLQNATNQGSSKTRKIALPHAHADYVIYFDGDDWIEINMLEKMYIKAISNNYDIVWCNYFSEKDTSKPQKEQIRSTNKINFLKEIFTERDFTSALWNKLIKREILLKVKFPTANQSEDIPITLQLIYYADTIAFIDDVLYHHFVNMDSLTKSESRIYARMDETYENNIEAINFLQEKFGEEVKQKFEPILSNYVNRIKIQHMLQKQTRDIKKLYKLYPESNNNIFNKNSGVTFICKLAFIFTIKTKILFLFSLIEALNPTYKFMQCIYRKIIPQNIRKRLWNRKMEQLKLPN